MTGNRPYSTSPSTKSSYGVKNWSSVENAIKYIKTLPIKDQYPHAVDVIRQVEKVQKWTDTARVKLFDMIEGNRSWALHETQDAYQDRWDIEHERAGKIRTQESKIATARRTISKVWIKGIMSTVEETSDTLKFHIYENVRFIAKDATFEEACQRVLHVVHERTFGRKTEEDKKNEGKKDQGMIVAEVKKAPGRKLKEVVLSADWKKARDAPVEQCVPFEDMMKDPVVVTLAKDLNFQPRSLLDQSDSASSAITRGALPQGGIETPNAQPQSRCPGNGDDFNIPRKRSQSAPPTGYYFRKRRKIPTQPFGDDSTTPFESA
ncbi:hypothetical protein MMC30_001881 [Trapelia coarctata]|nr:hypothetical protein [Trapelia coarctata]